ncbi:hypothetical protein BDF22DRAFT_774736 [Syncephalis plumigaleata]|nr:hypothetical protein BDF22DRAFT_774736 [Syncephalis plumigaleata]
MPYNYLVYDYYYCLHRHYISIKLITVLVLLCSLCVDASVITGLYRRTTSSNTSSKSIGHVYTVSVGERCGLAQDLHRCIESLVCDIKPGQSLGLCKRACDTPIYFNDQAVEVVRETTHTSPSGGNNHHEPSIILTEEITAIDSNGIVWHTIDYGRTWTNTTLSNGDQAKV